MEIRTKSEAVAEDVAALLRARNPLLWVVTREEARVEGYLIEAAASASYITRTWDVGQGVTGIDGSTPNGFSNMEEPDAVLKAIKANVSRNERCVWIMRDLPVWLSGPQWAATLRQVRNLARSLPGAPRSAAQAIVVLSPSADVPPELAGHATVVEWPLPDREEIGQMLKDAVESLPEELQKSAAPNGTRDAAIDAAIGLSGEEVQACFARSLVQSNKIDPATIAKEKKRVVARERVLEWFDPLPGGLDSVGGLDLLKGWLVERKSAYSPAARAYGLPSPKGTFLLGITGCGKSLTAKAVATAWGVPLLKIDLGALKSKFVGDSEANLRKAFKVIEAIGRCVVWIDEIEKQMQGATSGSSDGGVSADALGAILNWMQERAGEAFVIATANDIEGLPPELLRKGRFDELWWVDLPTALERVEIMKATLRGYGRGALKLEFDAISAATEGFTGAEIAAIVPDAMFVAFNDKAREIRTNDILNAAQSVTPISKTAKEKIEKLRAFAATRARSATSADVKASTMPRASRGRQLDLTA